MPQSFAEELGRVPKSRYLGDSLERAYGLAREQSHRLVTLEHVLFALTEDPEAAVVLQASQIDIERLRTDVSRHLGAALDSLRGPPGADPRPDPDMLRILQAAATAALQSRRKQIDGAIVLAAVVGDGRSAAAGILRAQGLTFEGAIRALQRVATQAHVQRPALPPVPARGQPPPAAGDAAVAPAGPVSRPSEAPPRPRHANGQPSTEEILASVRARLQAQEQTPINGSAALPPAPRPAGGSPHFPDETVPNEGLLPLPERPADAVAEHSAKRDLRPPRPEPAQNGDAREAAPPIEAASHGPLPPAATMAPPLPLPNVDAQPPAARNQQRPQAPPLHKPPLPFPMRPARDDHGPQRPPLPASRTGPPPMADRPEMTPWPEPVEGRPPPPAPPAFPAAADGDIAGAPFPEPDTIDHQFRPPVPQAPRGPGTIRLGQQIDTGKLIENIPRRMCVAVPETIEVRIGRDKVEGLAVGLRGRGAPQTHAIFTTRAMTVRLRAPSGSFSIEPGSPETQWIENTHGLVDEDFASWRWTVTPHRRGRGRLQLIVSARTVGVDGLTAETALPDQVVEVSVRTNYGLVARRWGGWIAAALVGGVLGKFGESVLDVVAPVATRLFGS